MGHRFDSFEVINLRNGHGYAGSVKAPLVKQGGQRRSRGPLSRVYPYHTEDNSWEYCWGYPRGYPRDILRRRCHLKKIITFIMTFTNFFYRFLKKL